MNFLRLLMLCGLLVVVIGIGWKMIIDFEYIPNLVPVESVKNREFDFIIVGGGTSGCVLSYHLSKVNANISVLLIEAGGIFNGLSIVPLLSTIMQGTRMDWNLKTTRQKHSSKGLINEEQLLPRGKGLGGSAQLNYLLHSIGLESDFDEWKKYGGDEWDYEGIKRFLYRHDIADDEGTNHQNEPKLSITEIRQEDSLLGKALMESKDEFYSVLAATTATTTKKDLNLTLNLARFTTQRGRRHSVFHEYLKRAFKHRNNLSIMIHGRVERIEFNEKREAEAVIVVTKSQTVRIKARREIILSAGAFHSPHILQLSGIGNGIDLENLAGVNLLHHLPAVGANLFDHMNFPLFVSINVSASVTRDKVLSFKEISRYLIHGTGVLSTTAVVGVGRLHDFGFILFGAGSVDEETLRHLANYKKEIFQAFFPLHANTSAEGFVMLSTCWHPKSRGNVKINPENTFGDPVIEPAYLREDYDVSCLINAVRMHKTLMETEPFRRMSAKIHWPKLKSCENFGPFDEGSTEVSERYLECLIRHAAVTGHHPGGTCALGSVVDGNFKVFGVEKLRVVDASIFPTPTTFFPNSIIVALAEKASEIILNQNLIENSVH